MFRDRTTRIAATTAFMAMVVVSPALPQGLLGEEPGDRVDDERARAESAEAVHSEALPPRSLNDITRALQRYKPDPQKAARDRAAAQAARRPGPTMESCSTST
jgi:hypothetical protein